MAHSSDLTWRTHRPSEGFYTSEVHLERPWPIRTFLPTGYEPNYPYPLLVFFHGHGSNEERILRLAPRLSRRNYICIAPRGPHVLVPRTDGQVSYSWGPESCDAASTLAIEKLGELDSKLAELQAMRDSLVRLVESCSRPRSERDCPLLETLVAEGGSRNDRDD